MNFKFNRTFAVFYAGIILYDGCLNSAVVFGLVKLARDLRLTSRKPIKKYGLLGGEVTLDCNSDDFPEVKNITSEMTMVMWKREKMEVPILIKTGLHPTHVDSIYRERISIGDKNSINISQLRLDDTGWYECVVVSLYSFEVPSNGSWTFLLVLAPIILKNASADVVKAEEGEKLDLFCQVGEDLRVDILTWLKNEIEVKTSDRLSMTSLNNSIKLSFQTLRSSDMAMYTCVFKNFASQASHNIHLFVQSSFPRLHGNPLKMYIPLGSTARIPCLSNHDNTAVYWTKDGQQLNQSHIRINHQGHLYIRSIQFNDQGLYICKPYSSASFQAHLTVLHIVVKVPVYFLVRPRPIYQRHANQSVTMPCVAIGDPTPTISWRKIGGSFPGKTKTLYDSGNLTVVQLSKEDQGQYECVAQNIVASVITTSLLIIEASPHSPPYNLTVRTTHNSAKVCWLPAYDNGHPQHYVLWYKVMDEKERDWTTMRIVPDDALCMTLHDLPSDTQFEFYVLSRNRLGEGLFSTPMTAETKSRLDDIQAESVDHQKVTDDGHTRIKNNGDDDDDEDDDDERESSGHVRPSIRLDKNLEGGFLKPLPPQNISVLKTKEGLYISWLPPITPVEHYLIQYKTKGQWVTLSDHVKRTYFTWLTPSFGASYQFRVVSFSKSQVQSEPSPVVTLETGNPMLSENSVSTKMIATLFGVIILVLLLIGSTVTLIRSCGPKRQQSSIRYDSVKYFGPSQLEPSQKILSAKQKSETSLSPMSSEHQVDKPQPSTLPQPLPQPQQPHQQRLLHSSLVQLSKPPTDVDSLSEQCYVNCTNSHTRKVILETPI